MQSEPAWEGAETHQFLAQEAMEAAKLILQK